MNNDSLGDRMKSAHLNKAIDRLYDELHKLRIESEEKNHPENVRGKIAARLKKLRALQKEEGDLIRQSTSEYLNGPIAQALYILEDAKREDAKRMVEKAKADAQEE